MRSTASRFRDVLARYGSDIVYHRESGGTLCPCLTPLGDRDPVWHIDNPGEPVCNEEGMLAVVTEFTIKGSIQPVITGYSRPSQRANQLLGDIERDDKIAILPCTWSNQSVDLSDWSEAGSDYLVYDGSRYAVVSYDAFPDVNGDPRHHYEVGLRLLSADRPS